MICFELEGKYFYRGFSRECVFGLYAEAGLNGFRNWKVKIIESVISKFPSINKSKIRILEAEILFFQQVDE